MFGNWMGDERHALGIAIWLSTFRSECDAGFDCNRSPTVKVGHSLEDDVCHAPTRITKDTFAGEFVFTLGHLTMLRRGGACRQHFVSDLKPAQIRPGLWIQETFAARQGPNDAEKECPHMHRQVCETAPMIVFPRIPHTAATLTRTTWWWAPRPRGRWGVVGGAVLPRWGCTRVRRWLCPAVLLAEPPFWRGEGGAQAVCVALSCRYEGQEGIGVNPPCWSVGCVCKGGKRGDRSAQPCRVLALSRHGGGNGDAQMPEVGAVPPCIWQKRRFGEEGGGMHRAVCVALSRRCENVSKNGAVLPFCARISLQWLSRRLEKTGGGVTQCVALSCRCKKVETVGAVLPLCESTGELCGIAPPW
eukprot:gene5786-biopygen5784